MFTSIIAVKEDAKVLIVATIAWGLRKCSRAIMLLLIFLIATKPGFVHAVYSMLTFPNCFLPNDQVPWQIS